MVDSLRNLPHIVLRSKGRAEGYTTTKQGPRYALPVRDRLKHAEDLKAALAGALALADQHRLARTSGDASGYYLDVVIEPGSDHAAEKLENRPKGIELVTVRPASDQAPAVATIFVPDMASGHLKTKIEEYANELTKPRTPEGIPKPKNQDLIARVQSITLAAIRSVFTDDLNFLPLPGARIWWEVWLRPSHSDSFLAMAAELGVEVQSVGLSFPERDVRLAYADETAMAQIFANTDSIAELRIAKDGPSFFTQWTNRKKAEWSRDLIDRLRITGDGSVAVCLLDTGVNRRHPLIAPLLSVEDVHRYDPTWLEHDVNGHGTSMAGVILYNDLFALLASSDLTTVSHRLESVKILPDQGENEPRLYGAITRDAIAQAEIAAPERRRVVCMAVSSPIGTNRGTPSSWSAALDALCFGDSTIGRLALVSAGNIRGSFSYRDYPARNETEPIENPGQAWNAITVGAYTNKSVISDPSFAGWVPLAAPGDLCPTSRTSVSWERKWAIKPDVVMEGGNWATDGEQIDSPDDLGILTTHRDPLTKHFDVIRDTSAATALAGNLAGRVMAALPDRWPETIRGLIIHSAEWTPAMERQLGTLENDRLVFFRKFGHGVPSYERAVLSAANDLTLIAEDEIQPFAKRATHEMKLHHLPWPVGALEELCEKEVELRVTLSYFVEPNPGERGWIEKHSYASHGLRFELKAAVESEKSFRQRINKQAIENDQRVGKTNRGPHGWVLGRLRDRGSIHSDRWKGTAMDLSKRFLIAVYPTGGWWKANPGQKRYDRKVRYSLIVSIRAPGLPVDLYTPVLQQVATSVEIGS